MAALTYDAIDEYEEENLNLTTTDLDGQSTSDEIYETPKIATVGRSASTMSRTATLTRDKVKIRNGNRVLATRKRSAEAFFRNMQNKGQYQEIRNNYDYEDKPAIILCGRSTANSVLSLVELAPPFSTKIVVVYIPQTLLMFDDVTVNESEYLKMPYTASLLRLILAELGLDIKTDLNSYVPYYATHSLKYGKRYFSLGRAPKAINTSVKVSFNSIMESVRLACFDLVRSQLHDDLLGHADMPGFIRDKHVMRILVCLHTEHRLSAVSKSKNHSQFHEKDGIMHLYTGKFDAGSRYTHIVQ